MQSVPSVIRNVRNGIVTSAALLIMLFLPVSSVVAADAISPATADAPVTTADPAPCVAPPDSYYGNGVHRPSGADANMFTYQCDGAYAQKWTSAYYVYDPVTRTKLPTYNLNYHYDCTAQQWYMTEWDFSASRNTYVQNTVAGNPPAGTPTGCPVTQPTQPTQQTPKTVDTDGDGIYDSPPTPAAIAKAEANGGSMLDATGNNTQDFTNAVTLGLTNSVLSSADTGDASVMYNNLGGDATSGNALSMATIINSLQSSSNILTSPDTILFTANINGDMNGDLLLNPATLGSVRPADIGTSLDNKVIINNSQDTAINNTIDLNAQSGNARVAYNNSGGDATSGNANAVANIVNTLNSAVTAGQSFIGVINVNGNLNGDILLPPNFVDTLLASNVPRYNLDTASLSSTTSVSNVNNGSVTNAVNASAQSGDASVNHNNSGGDATSGNAATSVKTNLTVFNLTGSNVVASNDLLVFVNVLGSWYGMIMNAPAGTTAASLGGGVTSNTTATNDTTLNNKNTQQINNNVTLTAKSGDASVDHNNAGGNAKSGNATASANILNTINSKLSLNGWFGLLFINVYGTWNGSFGVNTAAGDPAATPTATVGGVTLPVQTFGFVPTPNTKASTKSSSTSGSASDAQGDASATQTQQTQASGAVLAAHTNTSSSTAVTPQLAGGHSSYAVPIIGSLLALIILAASERKRFTGRHDAPKVY